MMSKIFNFFSCMTAVAGGALVYFLGAWDGVLETLVMLMILDYITGLIKAIYLRELSSKIGFEGLLKKVSILIIVALANIISELVSTPVGIREMVIIFYAANEGISILENSAVIIPNMPENIRSVLLQLRDSE